MKIDQPLTQRRELLEQRDVVGERNAGEVDTKEFCILLPVDV